MTPIQGSIVALVTPMHDDGQVDYPTLRRLIDWHIQEGTHCIGVVGTTGESPTVDVEEHCEIIRVAVEQAAGRVPVMAGAGANSTQEAIELARYAKKVGADCALQVVPYYNKPTQEVIYQHFKTIAEAVICPAACSRRQPRGAEPRNASIACRRDCSGPVAADQVSSNSVADSCSELALIFPSRHRNSFRPSRCAHTPDNTTSRPANHGHLSNHSCPDNHSHPATTTIRATC